MYHLIVAISVELPAYSLHTIHHEHKFVFCVETKGRLCTLVFTMTYVCKPHTRKLPRDF